MKGIISITGIKLKAYHGVYPIELKKGNDYIVDIWLTTDVAQAAVSDDLSTTVDYYPIYKLVLEIMSERANLLEYLSAKIARSILAEVEMVEKVKVKVRKLQPLAMENCEETSVEVECGRN